jgi:UDP-N-acetylglucosamine 3-dehydrogenase
MRIAVLGAGGMGTTHARIYAGALQEKVEIAAVFSRNLSRARALGKEVGTPPTASASDILTDDSIDAVDVCVPSAHHRALIVEALARGKHVFCETPLALTVRDADAMITAARKNRRLLAVAQVMRFVSPYVRARREVDSGRIGRPWIVSARRLSGPYWRRKRPRPFRHYGVPLVELSIHDIDVANWFLGRPESVLASGVVGTTGVAEQFLVVIGYRGGKAFVEGSAMMPPGFPFTTALRVQGDRGVLDLSGQFSHGPIPVETFHVYEEGGRKSLRVKGRDPYEEECVAFVRCIERRTGPMATSSLAEREALRVVEGAQKSLRAHGEVRL